MRAPFKNNPTPLRVIAAEATKDVGSRAQRSEVFENLSDAGEPNQERGYQLAGLSGSQFSRLQRSKTASGAKVDRSIFDRCVGFPLWHGRATRGVSRSHNSNPHFRHWA
jgi:hypothetical protein